MGKEEKRDWDHQVALKKSQAGSRNSCFICKFKVKEIQISYTRNFKHKEIQIWYVFLILSLHIWNSNFVYLVSSFLNFEFILNYASLNKLLKQTKHIVCNKIAYHSAFFSSFSLFWSPPVLPGTSTAHHNYAPWSENEWISINT